MVIKILLLGVSVFIATLIRRVASSVFIHMS
jgi:hypothetical protein